MAPTTQPTPQLVADVRAADVAAGGRRCTSCGCTDHAGCTPPCWWVSASLCSSCQP